MTMQQLGLFEEVMAATRRAEQIREKLNRIREELNTIYSAHPAERTRIDCPEDAADLLTAFLRGLPQEEFWVIPLDTRNGVIKLHRLYQGTLNAASIRVAEVFRVAILCNAASVIVAHNHPSGDPIPSPEDVQLTRILRQAGELLDIPLVDHIIVGDQWVSLRQRGLGF